MSVLFCWILQGAHRQNRKIEPDLASDSVPIADSLPGCFLPARGSGGMLMQHFCHLFSWSSIFFFFFLNHWILTLFWAGCSASRLLNCHWVLGWGTNLAQSDRAENAELADVLHWDVCSLWTVCVLEPARRGSDVLGSLRWQRAEALGGPHFCVWLETVSAFAGIGPRHTGAKSFKWQEAWEEVGLCGAWTALVSLTCSWIYCNIKSSSSIAFKFHFNTFPPCFRPGSLVGRRGPSLTGREQFGGCAAGGEGLQIWFQEKS